LNAAVGGGCVPRWRLKTNRIIGVAVAAVVALAVSSHAARAQSAPAQGSGRPKTLLELIFGKSDAAETKDQPDKEDRIDPDRPHFPEASTAVGLGRAVLESGYTFTKSGGASFSHSAPESLLRVGVFADWFELRIGQNFLSERKTAAGAAATASGAQDLYLGMKIALAEQNGVLPAIALIPQMTVPTGSVEVTAGKVLPGLNVDASWEVIKDRFSIEVLVANNLVRDDFRESHFELATGLTGAVQLTKKLEAFVEWDAFYPIATTAAAGPRHNAVGGLVYFLTSNFAVDIRAGVGLNKRSDDFLAGVGFALRY
jgi:outer membrane putative beta-barrel porin/alpha-amylase